jgi:hypothetical protein
MTPSTSRKHSRLWAVAGALPLLCVTAAGCGGSDKTTTPEPLNNDPTFTNVTKKVMTASNCAGPQCHSSALLSGFALGAKNTLYGELVGVAAGGPDCKNMGLTRVVAGKPEESLLYMKITGMGPDGGKLCGDTMPVNGVLTADQIDLVRRWIEAGAPND